MLYNIVIYIYIRIHTSNKTPGLGQSKNMSMAVVWSFGLARIWDDDRPRVLGTAQS